MSDAIREYLSYAGIYRRLFRAKKCVTPVKVSFGSHRSQYFLYYEPKRRVSDQVIVWIHGGGWHSGSPRLLDFVGQRMAAEGYRVVSLGYRLSPRYKYPCQIEDVCTGYNKAMAYLRRKGIDASKVIVTGPSAGAHLSAILCYSKGVQKRYGVDVSNVTGFIGVGGPYCFTGPQTFAVRALLDQLFARGYDRNQGEPCFLMKKTHIPALIIHSKHDGVVDYSCARRFFEKALRVGNRCELYTVTDKKNTHTWYTSGMFLETRKENRTTEKFFSWIEKMNTDAPDRGSMRI